MAAKADDEPSGTSSGDGRPLDRDEKVKLDLPFEQALRALLETQPEPEKPDKAAEKP